MFEKPVWFQIKNSPTERQVLISSDSAKLLVLDQHCVSALIMSLFRLGTSWINSKDKSWVKSCPRLDKSYASRGQKLLSLEQALSKFKIWQVLCKSWPRLEKCCASLGQELLSHEQAMPKIWQVLRRSWVKCWPQLNVGFFCFVTEEKGRHFQRDAYKHLQSKKKRYMKTLATSTKFIW